MKRKCKVVILDEVNAWVANLHPDHAGYFYEEYGLFAPNHFFNPKFKLGSWSGKIQFFHKTGKTFVHLLDDIIPRLIRLDYEIELDDQRNSTPIFPELVTERFLADLGVRDPDYDNEWIMRDYQVELVNALLTAGGGIGICGTGGGKTSMTAALSKSYEIAADFRSIIIVPDKNLTSQTHEEYQFFGLDTGQYSGEVKDIKHQHVVSTWQSLKNNPHIIQEFDMVNVDECLAPDTQITMNDGTTKNICEVQPGDVVLTYNETDDGFEPNVVVKQHENMMISSTEDFFELEFDNSTIIQVTGNHKILTNRGYVRADSLQPDDEIISLSARDINTEDRY